MLTTISVPKSTHGNDNILNAYLTHHVDNTGLGLDRDAHTVVCAYVSHAPGPWHPHDPKGSFHIIFRLVSNYWFRVLHSGKAEL